VEPSDEALCERVAQRDDAAFELLVERFQGRAYRLAWSIVRDSEDARDLSQEAFIRLYENAGSFGGRAKFSTWFYRIVVNLCLDHKRKRRWWKPWGSDDPDDQGESLLERQPAPTTDPVDELSRERTMKDLWAAVDRLAPRQRAAVVLQVQEELATYEIAEVLKCSEATVRVHLHRAMNTLKKTMKDKEKR
jgi:RNA polymerase sigma-70 factor, ECF subfamily